MRILANENIAGMLVSALRAAGHNVNWVQETCPGASDERVLSVAKEEARILLTCDKDFGELAYHRRIPPECGIVLIRVPVGPGSDEMERIAAVISSREDWLGQFSVIEPDRIRMRPLPHPV
jgi:predicted nuclease of predicted toxin-antitoxin system